MTMLYRHKTDFDARNAVFTGNSRRFYVLSGFLRGRFAPRSRKVASSHGSAVRSDRGGRPTCPRWGQVAGSGREAAGLCAAPGRGNHKLEAYWLIFMALHLFYWNWHTTKRRYVATVTREKQKAERTARDAGLPAALPAGPAWLARNPDDCGRRKRRTAFSG